MKPKITYTQEELVSEIKLRNQKAFAYLYDSYSKALFGVVYKVLNNTELSEDTLQNSFIKIWENINSYDPEKGRLYTWMLNIARNSAIDVLRSKHEVVKSKIQETTDAVYHKSGLFVNDKTHESIGLNDVVNKLNTKHKELIDLAYYQGYTQVEIAEKLNMPLGSVKTSIRQALLNLRELTADKVQ